MTEYFIGMHLNFDHDKYKRDFNHDIVGIEFCNFENSTDIEEMIKIAKRDKFKTGIHFPLDKSSYKYRDPLLLSLDENERKLAFKAVEKEIKYAAMIGAEYLLVHFPKPMILNENLEWEKCYFTYENEIIWENDYPYEVFEINCDKAFKELSDLSNKYKIQIVLEIEMLNKYLYKGDLLKRLLEKYSDIKLCLDSARIHVLSQIDRAFDYRGFIKEMAKYTYLLHLSNIKVTDKIEQGHHPVLKNLPASQGWCNIGEFLEIISSEKRDLKILFEHRSDILNYEELMQCYEWVKSYFKTQN